MNARTHFVYTAFDADGRVLYVGCTGRPEQRYKQHMAGDGDARGWFHPFVVRWHVSGPYPIEVARQMERARIEELFPVWNGHNPENNMGRREAIKNYLVEKGCEFIPDAHRSVPRLVRTKSASAA